MATFVCLFVYFSVFVTFAFVYWLHPTPFNDVFGLEKPENLHDVILWLSLEHLGFGADFLI